MRSSLPRLTVATTVALALAAGSLLTACSDGPAGSLPTVEPPTPAAAPPATSPLPGSIRSTGSGIDFLAVDADSGIVAMLGADRSTLLLTAHADPSAPIRSVPLGAAGAGLVAGRPGEVLVPAGDRVVRVSVADGATTDVPTGGNAVSAIWAPDGTLAVGTSDGKVRLIDPESGQSTEIGGLVSVDGLAVTGDSLVALDRRQSSVTEIDLGDHSLGLALRAGEGATTIDGDRLGRFVVADSTESELLAFTADPLVLHQRFPVGSSPYAVAVDDRSGIVWLTSTATNEVVGYDLSSGIPKETARFATVRQPNSVAVDDSTGDLLVGSAAGEGLQTIPASSTQGGR
ncbi:hypothetical protein OG921_22135 [Aldersonia sp. NBC_00410]|uniref:hypothetical protein n=1 Tax=Aldersonia sp. NBC_00410 TaxID=2975954 RepID=UPI0022522263|nr:hypothetical protein [Aldersonia sp. NBC_00410]MCX5045872.1 hypothetical protein [Aldersonia sp. NBC_00410]